MVELVCISNDVGRLPPVFYLEFLRPRRGLVCLGPSRAVIFGVGVGKRWQLPSEIMIVCNAVLKVITLCLHRFNSKNPGDKEQHGSPRFLYLVVLHLLRVTVKCRISGNYVKLK
jgi:hypothetical protein